MEKRLEYRKIQAFFYYLVVFKVIRQESKCPSQPGFISEYKESFLLPQRLEFFLQQSHHDGVMEFMVIIVIFAFYSFLFES